MHINRFAVTVKFTSVHNDNSWKLSTIYGPCKGPERDEFVSWLNNLQIEEEENWMLIGDFNFYRSLTDRNRKGDNMNDVFIFNGIISNLSLLQIPLKGRKYT